MELNAELDELLNIAESQIKASIKKHGGFDAFALILKKYGSLDTLQGSEEPLYGLSELGYFISELKPLARRGEIKASAICTSLSVAGEPQKAAIIDLEHGELLRAVVMFSYEKRLLSWSLGARHVKQESPEVFAPSKKAAPCEVAHQDFLLKLGEGWRRIASDDPDRFMFYSDEKKASIVVSVAVIGPIPLDRLLGAANALAESRLSSERGFDPSRKTTIGSCKVELKENGQAGHVSYSGYDDAGSIFHFAGWVTKRKIFSLWVSLETSDDEYSRNVFYEVFDGISLCIP